MIVDDNISASRPLTDTESMELKSLLKSHLKLHNSSCAFQAEADADDLLTYALDMVEDGNAIQYVCDEIKFMELEICNDEVISNIKQELGLYLSNINKKGTKKNWRENHFLCKKNSAAPTPPTTLSAAESMPESSLPLTEDPPMAGGNEEDNEEEEEPPPTMPKLPPPLKTGNYLIDQMAMDEYKETVKKLEMQMKQNSKKKSSTGTSNSSPTSSSSSSQHTPRKTGGSNYLLDQLNAEKEARRKAERTSSSSSTSAKGSTMAQASPRRASFEEDLKNSNSYVSTDLSAKAAAEKHKREMASLFGNGGTSAVGARSSRRLSYEQQLEADKVNNKIGKTSSQRLGASSLKDKYQQQLEADKVGNKKKAIPLWSAKQDVDDRDYLIKQGLESAKSSKKVGGGGGDDNGTALSTSTASTKDERRRDELMKIMKDKTLSKKEKSLKMAEVRAKYEEGGLVEEGSSSSSPSPLERKLAATGTTTLYSSRSSRASGSSKYSVSGAGSVSSFSYNTGATGEEGSSSPPEPPMLMTTEPSAEEDNEEEEEPPPTIPKLPPPLKTGNYLIDQMAMDEYKETLKKLEMQMKQNSKKKSSTGTSNSSPASSSQHTPRKTGGSNYLLDQLNAEKEARRKAERMSTPSTETEEQEHVVNPSSSSSSKPYEEDLKNSNSYVSTDLSAKAAAEKHKREMASLFGNGGKSAVGARSIRRLSYEQQLEADRVNNKIGKPEPVAVIVDEKSSGTSGSGKGVSDNVESTSSHQTLDQQRRQELQQIMKDKSLNKEERRLKMDEVRNRYAALALEQQNGTSSSSTSATSQEGGEDRHLTGMDLSASAYAQKPKKEIEAIKNSVVPVSERMSKINMDLESNAMKGRKEKEEVAVKDKRRDSTYAKVRTKTAVIVDHTAFAVAYNGLYGVQRDKKKQARSEYAGRF